MDTSTWRVGMALETNDPLFKERPEYTNMLGAWLKCRDAAEGAHAVKSKGTAYLPPLDSHVTEGLWGKASEAILTSGGFGGSLSPEGVRRYETFKERAVWYGATGLTVEMFVNMIFRRNPVISWKSKNNKDIVEPVEGFTDDFSVHRDDMTTFLREVVREVLITNRVGILEDRAVDSPKSYSVIYKAEQIINWGETRNRGYVVPDYYVLNEVENDLQRYRVLLLNEDKIYQQALFVRREVDTASISNPANIPMVSNGQYSPKKDIYVLEELITPTVYDDSGTGAGVFNYIPFWLIDTNGKAGREVKAPRIYDLVECNLGLYRNSADYENELHTVSIKTACFPGWNIDEHGIPALGGALLCPPGDTGNLPFILEPSMKSELAEAMGEKRNTCAILGSQVLAARGKYLQAKETAQINASSDTSTVEALSAAIENVMKDVFALKLQWMREPNIKASLALNTQYFHTGIDPAELKELVASVQAGQMSFETLFWNLEQRNMYPDDWTREDERTAIQNTPLPNYAASEPGLIDTPDDTTDESDDQE